jgi:hypothetical protein
LTEGLAEVKDREDDQDGTQPERYKPGAGAAGPAKGELQGMGTDEYPQSEKDESHHRGSHHVGSSCQEVIRRWRKKSSFSTFSLKAWAGKGGA